MFRAMRLVCGLFCVVALAVAAPASAILNGTPDTTHTYVGAFTDGHQICSGFLVSPRVAVTAGHCFADGTTGIRWTFAQKIPTNQDDPRIVTGGEVHVMHGYCCGIDNPQSNDVAVIVLPPNESQSGPYATLAPVNSLGKNAEVTAVGYGITAFVRGGGTPRPLVGQRTSADLQTVHAGKSFSAEFLKLASSAGGHASGLCFGDSGGPLLDPHSHEVLALASFGQSNVCGGHSYGFRLDSAGVQNFIEDAVAQNQ